MAVEAGGPPDKLVVFDCDGVLVDSEVLVGETESVLLAAAGVDITGPQIAERFLGLSEPEMFRRIEGEWGVTLGEDFSRLKRERVAEALSQSLLPIKGIARVLAGLDVGRCVASSSNPERVHLSLERTGLARYFGANVFTASMVRRGKPAPDLFLLAAETMGVPPERCVVVEDSPFGVSGGVAAGMGVIGFTGGSHAWPAMAGLLARAGAGQVAAEAAELGRMLHATLDDM